MNKLVKRTSLTLVSLALLAVAAAFIGNELGERKLARRVEVAIGPIDVRTDAAHIEQGRYLFATRGCAECHGPSGAGKEVVRQGRMLVVSPNITAGGNSATTSYNAVDWVRTVRHGVKPNGNPVMVMPSEDYNRFTDEDMAALIAYVQQMPPVVGREVVMQLPMPVKVLYALGVIKDAAEKIDHKLAPPVPIAPAVSAAYGGYVANACISCHGAHLSGGKMPGEPPSWPAAANLTPGKGSAMVRYPNAEAFMAMLRSGRRPDGSEISSVMPFASFKQLNDIDVRALHAYLQTLSPLAAGNH